MQLIFRDMVLVFFRNGRTPWGTHPVNEIFLQKLCGCMCVRYNLESDGIEMHRVFIVIQGIFLNDQFVLRLVIFNEKRAICDIREFGSS
ncbi:Uncharacterised protein [Chlamydia abortus]|nr:Uncharacterised protein [Chlamydia abortus]